MKALQEELAALRAQNAAVHNYVPHTRTEEETRRTIIDIDLRAMGWTFDVDCMREVPVIGLPNGSGKGFADYVLYEITSSSRSSRRKKHRSAPRRDASRHGSIQTVLSR